MQINQDIINQFIERKIDFNKLLEEELRKIKHNENMVNGIRDKSDINRVCHEKFIELFRIGQKVGVDIYYELFSNILNQRLDGTCFNRLVNRISKISKKYAGAFSLYKNITEIDTEDEYDGKENIIPNVSLMKGYLSEIFYECLSKLLEKDEEFPFYNFIPNIDNEDNGVDGFAISKYDNKLTTVQFKYKSIFNGKNNGKIYLLERDIKQFAWQSVKKYDIPINTFGNMVIVTNCEGLHYHTDDEVFLNAFKVLNGDFLKSKIESFAFWNGLSDMIYNTLDYELTNEEKINLSKINTIKN